MFAERVASRGLNAQIQAESLKFKLLGNLAVRRACSGVLRFVMESGAKGAEVSVSGKVGGQRAKTQKFCDGYMIKSGHAKTYVKRIFIIPPLIQVVNSFDFYTCQPANMWNLLSDIS